FLREQPDVLAERRQQDVRLRVEARVAVVPGVDAEDLMTALHEVRSEQRADVALVAGHQHPHAASRSRLCSSSASAAALIAANSMPERSAASRSEWSPSERLSTQRRARSPRLESTKPPTEPRSPRRPSCGSQ